MTEQPPKSYWARRILSGGTPRGKKKKRAAKDTKETEHEKKTGKMRRAFYAWRRLSDRRRYRSEIKSRATAFQAQIKRVREEVSAEMKIAADSGMEKDKEIERLRRALEEERTTASRVAKNLTTKLLKATMSRGAEGDDVTTAMSHLRDELNKERLSARKLRNELIEKTAAFDEHLAQCDATSDKLHVVETRLEQKAESESRLLAQNTHLEAEVARLKDALVESQRRESVLEKHDLDSGSRALALRQDLATAQASSGATVAEVLALRDGVEERDLVIEQLTGRVKTMESRLAEHQTASREHRAEEHAKREKDRKRLLDAEHSLTIAKRESAEEMESARKINEDLRTKIRELEEKLGHVTDELRRTEARARSATKGVESHETVVKDLSDRVDTLRMQLDVEQKNVESLREESTKERRVATMLRARLDAQKASEKDVIESLQKKEEEVIRLSTQLNAKCESEAIEKERVARDKAAALDAQDAVLDLEEKLAKSEARRNALKSALGAAEKKIAEQVSSWAASQATSGATEVDMLRRKLAKSEQERMKLASVLLRVMRSKSVVSSSASTPFSTTSFRGDRDGEFVGDAAKRTSSSSSTTLPQSSHRAFHITHVDESSRLERTTTSVTDGGGMFDQENAASNTMGVAERTLRRLENVLARGEELRRGECK